jgi:hypothetical protein
MKRRILFKSPDDIIIFKDSQNESVFYGMTKEVLIDKMRIVSKYGTYEKEVPDEEEILVYPVKFVKQIDDHSDEYAPEMEKQVKFPINRIEWLWIQVIKP